MRSHAAGIKRNTILGVSLNDARNTRDKTKPPGIVLMQDFITGMTTEDTQEV